MTILIIWNFIFILSPIISINYINNVSCYTENFHLYSTSQDTIYSLDNNTKITMQSDGDLVLYSRETVTSEWQFIWHTDTYNYDGSTFFAVQKDRNLVVYTSTGCTNCRSWQANIACQSNCGNGIYHFVVHNNGYAILLDENGISHFNTSQTMTSSSSTDGISYGAILGILGIIMFSVFVMFIFFLHNFTQIPKSTASADLFTEYF